MNDDSETSAPDIGRLHEMIYDISQRIADLENQSDPLLTDDPSPALVQNYDLASDVGFKAKETTLAHGKTLYHCQSVIIHRQHAEEATDQKTINIKPKTLKGTAKVQVWAGPPGQEGSAPPSDVSRREWNKDQVKESRSLTVDPGENIYLHYDKGNQARTDWITIRYEIS